MINTTTRNIKCIIIDDEKEACDRLENLLCKFSNIEIMAKETSAELGIRETIRLYPDLVFLDVEMPCKTGFDVLHEVRENDVFPTFIFVTGHNQYAVKAIKNAAFDYLLKPVDIDELKEAIDRFITSLKEKQKIILPEKLKSRYLLTNREIEIVEHLLEGKTSEEISGEIFISKHTVDTHRRNILEKLGIKCTGEILKLMNKF